MFFVKQLCADVSTARQCSESEVSYQHCIHQIHYYES